MRRPAHDQGHGRPARGSHPLAHLPEQLQPDLGEAQASTDAFLALSDYEQGSIIEFLKSLQVLPPDAKALVVDEKGNPRNWPPRGRGR